MKNLEYYMNLLYKMNIIKDTQEGGYTASFPELKGCLTCGETLDDAIENAENAKKEWLVAALEENMVIPEPLNP